VSQTSQTVTTRVRRRCNEGSLCAGTEWIEPGDDYARHVAFPDGDINCSDRPWVMRLCVPCQTRYGRPMPPRRTRTVAA
jgi:hypothetical protein